MKKITILSICLILWLSAVGCDKPKGDWETGTITFAISAYNAAEAGYTMADEDGYLIAEMTVDVSYGDSVLDVTQKVCKEAGMAYEKNGNYINSFHGLASMHYGDMSGWMFFVNGESVDLGCDEQQVQPGDEIVWEYTVEMGDTPVSRDNS